MAKGVGLDIGEYEIKVVELDGSYKRPRLTKVSIDGAEATADPDDEASRAADALHVLKDAGIARENVCMGFPCREVVQRIITVPMLPCTCAGAGESGPWSFMFKLRVSLFLSAS